MKYAIVGTEVEGNRVNTVIKIIKKYKILIAILIVIFILLFSKFVYTNIIVPWPYRHQLKACLIEAKLQSTEQESKDARNICFRTYPHFN